MRQDIERADTNINARRYLKREKDVLERQLYYRLQIRNPRDNRPVSGAINDFMQGIRISDSAPLDFSSLTLAGKYDRKPDGTVSPLPIFRECLKPDSEASLVITLDLPVLAKVGLTLGDIEKSLHSFADEYYANFEQHFAELSDDAPLAAQQGVDVYKRQGEELYLPKPILFVKNQNREGDAATKKALKGVEYIPLSYFQAVSYTHLDVYKRQYQGRPEDLCRTGS